jgi:hypothetical protein
MPTVAARAIPTLRMRIRMRDDRNIMPKITGTRRIASIQISAQALFDTY